MGFCLINNVVVAARWALDHAGLGRVLIIDWDVHHGNGTQALVEKDARIRYVSLHQWPLYPGTGREDERGVGNIFNVPRAAGLPRTTYLADLNAELPLYERAGELIALLTRLPLRSAHLPGQIEEVVIALYEYGILDLADVELTQAFLLDLIDIGYEFPPMRLKPRHCRGQTSDAVVYGGECPGREAMGSV